MKRFFFPVSIVVMVVSVLLLIEKMNASPRELVTGVWRLRHSQPSGIVEIRELDFANSGVLFLDINSSVGEEFNLQFHYKYLDGNRIKITGRLSDEWEIEKQGESLVVRTAWWPSREGMYIFTREPNIDWSLFSVAVFAFLTLVLITLWESMISDLQDARNFVKRGKSAHSITLQCLFAFLSGIPLGVLIWNWSPILRIRMPWDSVICVEINVFLLILAFLAIKSSNRADIKNRHLLTKGKWQLLLGVLIGGSSLWGLGISAIKLALFFFFGSYLN